MEWPSASRGLLGAAFDWQTATKRKSWPKTRTRSSTFWSGASCDPIPILDQFGSSSATTDAREPCAVSANCRRLLVVVAFAVASFPPITEGSAGDGFGQNIAPAPNDCRVIYDGSGSGQSQLIEVHAQANIQCG